MTRHLTPRLRPGAWVARCNTCPATPPPTEAVAHELGNPGHRVTVWDTPTSQVPRSLWPAQTAVPPATGRPLIPTQRTTEPALAQVAR